jgi:uncharacterized membrane protein YhaH (DUF805 family)
MPFPIENYLNVLANFDFRGRANRAEFWWFLVVNAAVGLAVFAVGNWLELNSFPGQRILSVFVMADNWPAALYGLLTYVQIWAQSVRRFHDRAHSGWWLAPFWLAGLVAAYWAESLPPLWLLPLMVPTVIFLVVCALPGDAGANRFGAPPAPLREGQGGTAQT